LFCLTGGHFVHWFFLAITPIPYTWDEKEFDVETYVDGKYVRKLKAKNVVCHLWDGETCLGEKYLYKEGRPCRYARAHQPGRSTLNLEKLRSQAERYQVGHKIPELLENMATPAQGNDNN
jgi:hypothetical protein